MKNTIEYYYGFININIIKDNKKMFFDYNEKKYKIVESLRSLEELNELYNLLINNNIYNKIVLTINKQVSIILNNKQYILEKKNNNIGQIDIRDILLKKRINNLEKYKLIKRNNWYKLWIEKVDYINYQRTHIKGSKEVLEQYIDYYIGLSENAISYFLNANNTEKDERDLLTISHRRINSLEKEEYYDANNIILDHYTRDIGEYFKYLFFNENIDVNQICKVVSNLNLSEYGFRLLYCRLLFPTYFFDIYERIINNNEKEEEIIKIINKNKKYEEFLKIIYKEINKKTRIPSINWISS